LLHGLGILIGGELGPLLLAPLELPEQRKTKADFYKFLKLRERAHVSLKGNFEPLLTLL